LAPVLAPSEEPYQTFYRRSHFSMKNREVGAILEEPQAPSEKLLRRSPTKHLIICD